MINNQKGLTLVELLVVLVISSIIVILSTSIIVQTLDNNRRIQQDIALRDEADYIMSLLFRELYTLKQSGVIEEPTNNKKYLKVIVPENDLNPKQKNSSYTTCSKGNCETIVGFINTNVEGVDRARLYIFSEEISISNPNLILHKDSTISKSKGDIPTYILKIGLFNKDKNSVVWFENEINTINDLTQQ